MARMNWDKESILKKLRGMQRADEDLSYNAMARKMQSLVSAAAYHFGSYRKAVEKAGIDYADVSRRPRWTKPIIIKLIKQAHRDGEDLHWAAVSSRRDELGRAAFASLQKRLFGSWDRALHASGLDADEISRYRSWDRDSVIFELKALRKDKEPLNSGAIQRSDPGLHAAAIRRFGSYDAALRAAGVDPADVRRRRRWTREQVVKEIKAFYRQHRQANDLMLRQHAPALYGAAMRLFGTVTAARAAAGVTSGKKPRKAAAAG